MSMEFNRLDDFIPITCDIKYSRVLYCNRNNVILTFSSLAAPEVVIWITFSEASEVNLVKMTTFSFPCKARSQAVVTHGINTGTSLHHLLTAIIGKDNVLEHTAIDATRLVVLAREEYVSFIHTWSDYPFYRDLDDISNANEMEI